MINYEHESKLKVYKKGEDRCGHSSLLSWSVFTALLGIAGSLLATYGGRLLGLYGDNSAAGFIASVIGAIIILFLYNLVSKKSGG